MAKEKAPSKNQKIAMAFARQFDPIPPITKTARINNVPYPDAWLIGIYDDSSGYGITAHAFNGQIHAFIEWYGSGQEAERVGKSMAGWHKSAKIK